MKIILYQQKSIGSYHEDAQQRCIGLCHTESSSQREKNCIIDKTSRFSN